METATKRLVLMRFARGLAYTVAGSAIAYAIANVGTLAAIAPRYAFLVPIISAGLLAADKWLRARKSAPQ